MMTNVIGMVVNVPQDHDCNEHNCYYSQLRLDAGWGMSELARPISVERYSHKSHVV